MSHSVRGSRHEYEPTSVECPRGCSNTDPLGRQMRLVTHHTGQSEINGTEHGPDFIETVDRHYECPVCGWVIDA